MSKSAYTTDVVDSHTGFMGKFELDLVLVTSGPIEIGSFVAVKDSAYKANIRTQYFRYFSQARQFFIFLMDEESQLTDINSLHKAINQFYNQFSGGDI